MFEEVEIELIDFFGIHDDLYDGADESDVPLLGWWVESWNSSFLELGMETSKRCGAPDVS